MSSKPSPYLYIAFHNTKCFVYICVPFSATDPARLAAAKRPKVNPFETNQEGKLVITESEGVGDVGGDMMDDMDTNEVNCKSIYHAQA